MLKSTSFTFGTLLGIYLAGVGLGSLAGSFAAERCSRRAAAMWFLTLQTAVAAYAALAIAALMLLLEHWPGLAPIADYFGTFEPLDMARALVTLTGGVVDFDPGPDPNAVVRLMAVLYGVLPVLLVGPPTFLMGCSFPFLQRAVQNDAQRLGRRVGWLQSANIAGSLVGSLVTGFALLPLLGTAATLRVIAVAALAFAALAAAAGGRRLALGLAITAALAALARAQQRRDVGTAARGRSRADPDGRGRVGRLADAIAAMRPTERTP